MKEQVIQGDCLETLKDIPDKSIDMILCDLPYGYLLQVVEEANKEILKAVKGIVEKEGRGTLNWDGKSYILKEYLIAKLKKIE